MNIYDIKINDERCQKCAHIKACEAWVRHGTMLYNDFSYDVQDCPHYSPVCGKCKWWIGETCTNKNGAYGTAVFNEMWSCASGIEK